jgi:ABC-type uncharacterized transport system permease subunit
MFKDKTRWVNIAFQLGAIVLSLGFTTLMLVAAGAPPIEAFSNILIGAFSSIERFSKVLIAWVPLLLASAGLLVTFAAGLWNIGVEGQIMMGAIFTTWMIRLLVDSSLPPWLVIVLAMLFGMVGGALWASLAGLLKTFGGVNEIFGGLGMNFVASATSLWLIFGPWKRPGVGSMSGTEPFPEQFWLPEITGLDLSGWSIVLGLLAIVIIYLLLGNTYFGLRLKAVGSNIRAAFRLGIPTWEYMILSFIICGMFAGLAGGLQVTAVYHRLIPSISSSYGFTGLLVAMLINYRAIWVAPIALFFAALNIGSIQLPIVLKLDSALSGVIQGSLVLFVLAMDGVRQRIMKNEGK